MGDVRFGPPRDLVTHTVTIANGQTKSGILDRQHFLYMAMIVPSAFTGTNITFEGSIDGSTFKQIVDEAGTAVSLTAASVLDKLVVFNDHAVELAVPRFLKIVSDGAEAADRDFTVFLATA